MTVDCVGVTAAAAAPEDDSRFNAIWLVPAAAASFVSDTVSSG